MTLSPSLSTDARVVIVGAGIHGLACALALTELGGVSIRIVSKEPVHATTSTVAGGLIEPFFVGGDMDRVLRWFRASRARLGRMRAETAWHVHHAPVRSFSRVAIPDPPWAALVDGFSSHAASPQTAPS